MPSNLLITVCGHADENGPLFLTKANIVHVGFLNLLKFAKPTSNKVEALGHYRRIRDEIQNLFVIG